MARPWQLDIRLQCPHCVRTMDVTVDVRHQGGGETKATCPYCGASFVHERQPGCIVSIGRRD